MKHPDASIVIAALCIAAVCVDGSTFLWTANAPWIWAGFRSVTLSASGVALLLLAIYGLRTAPSRVKGQPEQKLFLAAGLILVASTAISGLTAIAPLLSLGRLVEIGVGLLAAWTLARRARLARWIVVGLSGAILVELPFALLQEATQSTFPMETWFYGMPGELPASAAGAAVAFGPAGVRWQRAMGSFLHPNILGGFLAAALILGLVTLQPKGRPTIGLLGVWIVGWIELGLTFSRAAILATILGLLVYSVGRLRGSGRRRELALLLGGTVAAGLVATALTGPILLHWVAPGRALLQSQSATQRILIDGIGLTLIRERPLLGVGAGNFSLATLRPPIDAAMIDPAHVVPILVAAESGVLAGAAWLVLVVSPVVERWRTRRFDEGSFWRAAAVIVTLLTLSLLDHYLWTLPQGQATFWLTLGAAAAGPWTWEATT